MMNRFFTLLFTASCLTAVGQNEISTCSDTLVIGDSQDFDSYLWNTGETGQFLTVTGAGTYTRSNFNVSSTELDFFTFDNEEKIEIAHDEALDFGSDPFTIQLWYRNFGGATSDQSTVIDKYGSSGCTSTQMWMLLIRGTDEQYAGHLIFEGRQNSTSVSLLSNAPVDDGQWHHIVIQRTEALSLFVDGELQEQVVAGADWIFDNDEVVQIGGGHCDRYTPGNIGPLTIHKSALFGEGAVYYSPEDSSTATLYVSPNSIDGEYACTWENPVVVVSPDVVTDSFIEDTATLHSVVEYNVQFLVNGCIDEYACNFDAEAACDDGSCDYSCCPGPGCCTEGMYWDWELSGCYNVNPADINLDGCVQLNDLLDLLSAYGDCGAEESAWQCGDPLEYQGYDYATVQIGEQCWFAENLRAENYRNGDAVTSQLSDLDWSGATYGAVAVFGEGESSCSHDSPEGDACLPSWSISQFGRLYNWYAVNDERALCKTGWHVPSDEDWIALEMTLGMSEVLANSSYYRGTQEGRFLKDSMGWSESNNGNNSSGFTGKPAGYRLPNGDFDYAGYDLGMWSSTPADDNKAMRRNLTAYPDFKDLINRGPAPRNYGLSVRCVTDVY